MPKQQRTISDRTSLKYTVDTIIGVNNPVKKKESNQKKTSYKLGVDFLQEFDAVHAQLVAEAKRRRVSAPNKSVLVQYAVSRLFLKMNDNSALLENVNDYRLKEGI